MKLQNRDDALKTWEKNKYVDWNNVHYIEADDSFTIETIQNFNEYECKTCLIIDNLCELYYRHYGDNSQDQNDSLINRILVHEMNVYGLMRLKESFGFMDDKIDDNECDISRIMHYLYSSEYSKEDIDKLKIIDNKINLDPRTDCAKWCKNCGARKPNIYK